MSTRICTHIKDFETNIIELKDNCKSNTSDGMKIGISRTTIDHHHFQLCDSDSIIVTKTAWNKITESTCLCLITVTCLDVPESFRDWLLRNHHTNVDFGIFFETLPSTPLKPRFSTQLNFIPNSSMTTLSIAVTLSE